MSVVNIEQLQKIAEVEFSDKVEQAILFGSYAQGTFNDWSDIDLAIVSTAFAGERFIDRNKIRRIKLNGKRSQYLIFA